MDQDGSWQVSGYKLLWPGKVLCAVQLELVIRVSGLKLFSSSSSSMSLSSISLSVPDTSPWHPVKQLGFDSGNHGF